MALSLQGVKVASKPVVSLADDAVKPFISASFVFRTKESKAGQTCSAQLSLTSSAFEESARIVLRSIRVESQGSLKPIVLEHEEQEGLGGKLVILPSTLTEEFSEDAKDDLSTLLRGRSDLTLVAGQTRVFELDIPLRESGDAEVTSLLLSYRCESFDLDYSMRLSGANQAGGWRVTGSTKPKYSRPLAHHLHILPRPPKMEIKLVDMLDQYYANEQVELQIELLNAEAEAANVKLEVLLGGKAIPSFELHANGDTRPAESGEDGFRVSGMPLSRIASAEACKASMTLEPADGPTTYTLQIKAYYHLESDPATPIVQVLVQNINIVNAFEANYDLLPRLHADPWPSLFDPEGVQEAAEDQAAVTAKGLAQKWCLKCHYASFAVQDIVVVGLEAKVLSAVGGAQCKVLQGPEVPTGGITMAYKTMHEASFDILAQKLSLDDRAPVSLELAFVIQWRRAEAADETTNTTTMVVGKYLVLGSEPRVLASVAQSSPSSSAVPTPLTYLTLTIENPSNHLLTFGLAMEPSDEFAFSGAKQTTLHLLPLSRRAVTYRLLPLVAGGDYIRPGLVVRDKYFQKVLRIIPTEGMKIDKEGLLVWMPGEEDGVARDT